MKKVLRCCGVILAAGASSRMGRDKALLPWPPGQAEDADAKSTFLSCAIDRLKSCTETVIVVGGANASLLEQVIREASATLCINPTPELGQFSSLKLGLREARDRGCDAAIIAPVDRPPIRETTMTRLYAAFVAAIQDGYWAVIPEFNGRHGHPLAVGLEMMEAFLSAPVTSSAREVIHGHAEKVLYVEVEDPAVSMNVNTWEEYLQLGAFG